MAVMEHSIPKQQNANPFQVPVEHMPRQTVFWAMKQIFKIWNHINVFSGTVDQLEINNKDKRKISKDLETKQHTLINASKRKSQGKFLKYMLN